MKLLAIVAAIALPGCSFRQPPAPHVCGNADCCDWDRLEDGRWVRSAGEPWTDETLEAHR